MRRRELIELTDDVADWLVPMAPDAIDVCPMCRAGKGPRQRLCSSCTKTSRQVEYPLHTVVPISYYVKPDDDHEPSGPFRDAVHGYKESEDPDERAEFGLVVGGIFARYLYEHGDALAGVFGDWDEIVAVPSTKSPPPSTLARILTATYSDFVPAPVELLTNGPGHMDFVRAAEDGFELTTDVDGARILLIDDTFTTGARTQSAAHALHAGGAEVVVGITVARKIRINAQYKTIDLWDRQSTEPFSFTEPPWWADG